MLDAHCHIYDSKLDDKRDEILKNLSQTGQICICSSDNVENSKKSVELAQKYDFIYATVGTHPHEVEQFLDSDLDIYREMLKSKKVVAVGEIGLDYYYDKDIKEKQKEVDKLSNETIIRNSVSKIIAHDNETVSIVVSVCHFGSPGRIRTYDLSVNSRVLHH